VCLFNIKGHELKNVVSKFLFQIFLNAKTRIKVCYVNIGVQSWALFAYVFASKQLEEGQSGRGSEGNREKDVLGKYAVRHSVFV